MRGLVDAMEQAVKAKDAHSYHLLNLRFHDRLVEMAGNAQADRDLPQADQGAVACSAA